MSCSVPRPSGLFLLALVSLTFCFAPASRAQQFVFAFKNPAFGGPYLNYQWLLSSAEAQKDFREESKTPDILTRDPLADFQQNLQRQILSQLSRELITNRFRDLDLTKEGRFDLGDFLVEVTPGLTGVDIQVVNNLTGQTSTITIPNY